MVLVANPAAASEGISLHTVCHHAIFVDRTFNAAHYIQAEDRIHRIGLSRMQATTIEILVAEDSVDEVVQLRLNAKIALMAQILNDPSLGSGPISFESLDEESDEVGGLSEDDLKEVLNHLRSAQWLTR
jgi:SNF2 family DNA or RNA helicase